MRSCEHLATSGKRVTVNIRVKHALFLNERGSTTHQRIPGMQNAHSTSIIFENKKNKVKWYKSTQESTPDPLLKPTRATSSII